MNDVISKAELIRTCNLAYQYILDTAVEGQQGRRLTHAQCADLGSRLSQIWQATSDTDVETYAQDTTTVPIGKWVGTVGRNWLADKAERIVDSLTSMRSSDPNDDTAPADRLAFMRKTKQGEINLGGVNHNKMTDDLIDELTTFLKVLGISVVEPS